MSANNTDKTQCSLLCVAEHEGTLPKACSDSWKVQELAILADAARYSVRGMLCLSTGYSAPVVLATSVSTRQLSAPRAQKSSTEGPKT